MKDLDAAFHYLDVQPKEFLVDGDQAAVRVTSPSKAKQKANRLTLKFATFGMYQMVNAQRSLRSMTLD